MSLRPAFLLSALVAAGALLCAVVLLVRTPPVGATDLIAVCCVSLAASLMTASFAAARASANTAELAATSVSSCELIVDSDMLPTDTGHRGLCRVILKGRALGDAYVMCDERFDRGTKLRCVGRFSEPNDDDWGRSLRDQGIVGSIRAVRMLEVSDSVGLLSLPESLRLDALRTLDSQNSESDALIAALSLGWRADLGTWKLRELFSVCGISHIAAVSGTHVSVVCAMLATVLVRLRASVRVRFLLLAVVTLAYTVLVGAPASAVRAWLMWMFACGAELAGRRAHALSAVSFCCLAMALVRPGLSGNTGFLLSFCCVCGLTLFADYGAYAVGVLAGSPRYPRIVPGGIRMFLMGCRRGFLRGLAVALVAAMVSLPITASAFGNVSFIGPLVNALIGVPFAFLVSLSVVAAATSWVPLFQLPFLAAARLLASLLLALLRFVARIPGASVSVDADPFLGLLLLVGASIVLYVLWPDVDRRTFAATLALFAMVGIVVHLRWRFFAPPRVCVLDVGQGDAILIQEGPSAILVDTGPDGSAAKELAQLNVGHLDAVVLTHLHDDHVGGLDELFGQVACERVYVADGALDSIDDELGESIKELTGYNARALNAGDVIGVGNYSIEVIWPREPAPGTVNEDSLVMDLVYDHAGKTLTALLTGDAEHDVLSVLAKSGLLGDIDLLKVGHHGSEVSVTAEDLRILRPELAVASAGRNNSYGHPSDACVDALKRAGAVFICTKDVGTVIVEPGYGRLSVHQTGAVHEVE